MFHLIIFSSVLVAEWPPFGKIAANSVEYMFSLYFVILVISRFGFEDWIWVLIASVPGLCISFYFCSEIYTKCMRSYV